MCQRDSGLQFLPGVGQGRPSVLSESSPRENTHMFRELPRLISDLERIFTALTEISVLTSSSPVSQSLMREIPAEILAASGSSSQGFTKAWPRHLTLSGLHEGLCPTPADGTTSHSLAFCRACQLHAILVSTGKHYGSLYSRDSEPRHDQPLGPGHSLLWGLSCVL